MMKTLMVVDYIVVVRYSSGNTFGNTFGHWHIEGAYQTFEKAENLEGVSVERMDIWK